MIHTHHGTWNKYHIWNRVFDTKYRDWITPFNCDSTWIQTYCLSLEILFHSFYPPENYVWQCTYNSHHQVWSCGSEVGWLSLSPVDFWLFLETFLTISLVLVVQRPQIWLSILPHTAYSTDRMHLAFSVGWAWETLMPTFLWFFPKEGKWENLSN